MEPKEKDFQKQFYVTKKQMLEIIEKTEIPTGTDEIRILHIHGDNYIVMLFNNRTNEGNVLLPCD